MLAIRHAAFRRGLNLADLYSLLLASQRHLDAAWLFKLASICHFYTGLGPARRPSSATSTQLGLPNSKCNLDCTWPFQLSSKSALLLALKPKREIREITTRGQVRFSTSLLDLQPKRYQRDWHLRSGVIFEQDLA